LGYTQQDASKAWRTILLHCYPRPDRAQEHRDRVVELRAGIDDLTQILQREA